LTRTSHADMRNNPQNCKAAAWEMAPILQGYECGTQIKAAQSNNFIKVNASAAQATSAVMVPAQSSRYIVRASCPSRAGGICVISRAWRTIGKKKLTIFLRFIPPPSDPPAIEGRMKGKKKHPIFLRFIPPPLVPPLERVARKAKRSTRSFCVSRLPFWALSCCGLLCCFCTGLARCSDKYRSQHVKARQCFRVFIASVVWIAGTL
jgi:hypothetical protein